MRNFILRMYVNLGEDISRGNGEALNSLYSLSQDSEKQSALGKIRDYWAKFPQPPAFAEAVISSFKRNGATGG